MNKIAAKPAPTRRPRAAAADSGKVPDEAAGALPIYQRIANELRRAITDGQYPIGARLPTEAALCESFGISRFTARAAIRLLSTAGLVTRRQRVGTVVIAQPGDARYQHAAASLPDLFQYAQDTELRVMYVGKVALSKALAQEFGAPAGEEWVLVVGLRHDHPSSAPGRKGARPICITRIFLNPMLKDIEQRLQRRKTAVYALIEREYKIAIHRVEQELQGVVLAADDAANLGCEPGAPALRIVRRYYSDDGQLVEVADNVHPSDRFSYRMELRK